MSCTILRVIQRNPIQILSVYFFCWFHLWDWQQNLFCSLLPFSFVCESLKFCFTVDKKEHRLTERDKLMILSKLRQTKGECERLKVFFGWEVAGSENCRIPIRWLNFQNQHQQCLGIRSAAPRRSSLETEKVKYC